MRAFLLLAFTSFLVMSFSVEMVDNIRFEVLDADYSIVNDVNIYSTSGETEFTHHVGECVSSGVSMRKGLYVFITKKDGKGYHDFVNKPVNVNRNNEIIRLKIFSDGGLRRLRLQTDELENEGKFNEALRIIRKFKEDYPNIDIDNQDYKKIMEIETDILNELQLKSNSSQVDKDAIQIDFDEKAINRNLDRSSGNH